jgi:hypothetical protein
MVFINMTHRVVPHISIYWQYFHFARQYFTDQCFPYIFIFARKSLAMSLKKAKKLSCSHDFGIKIENYC